MNEAYRIRSKVHVSFILYSRKLSLDSNFTQPAKFAIAFAEIKINFLPCSRGRHRLYVVINTILTNSLWNKNFTHESWEQKWQNFSGKKILYSIDSVQTVVHTMSCTFTHYFITTRDSQWQTVHGSAFTELALNLQHRTTSQRKRWVHYTYIHVYVCTCTNNIHCTSTFNITIM